MSRIRLFFFPAFIFLIQLLVQASVFAQESHSELLGRVRSIEERVKRIEANQKEILAREEKILEEIDRLRIWVHRAS